MISLNLYKHINNTDVAFMVLKKYFIPEKKGWKMKVRWWNIVNPNNVFDMNVIDNIFIKKEDINNWKIYK